MDSPERTDAPCWRELEAALCLDNVWESVVGRSGPVRVRFFCAWESVVSWVGVARSAFFGVWENGEKTFLF